MIMSLLRLSILPLLLAASMLHAAPEASFEDAWIAEAPPVSKVHAGYFLLRNTGDSAIELRGASSPQYRKIELHQSIEQDGVASMRRIESLRIAAGDSIEFAPGGYHLMLFTPASRLVQGDSVDIRFEFTDGTKSTTAKGKKQSGSPQHDHHHHHHH